MLGGPPLLPWLETLLKVFSASSLLEALSRKPGPKRLVSRFSYSSVARAFTLGLIIDQATFCLSKVIA